jgi:cell division protein FtsL
MLMKKNKKNKKKFTRLERFLYKGSFVIMFFLVLGIVFTSASVSKLNIELQEMNMRVETQEDTNQSLVMKINEMASLENIQIISKNLGLSYNNDNIKTIE